MLETIRRALYSRSGFQYFLILLFVGIFTCLRSFDLVALQPQSKASQYISLSTAQRLSPGVNLLQTWTASFPADQELEEAEEKEETEGLPVLDYPETVSLQPANNDLLSLCQRAQLRQKHFELQQRSFIPYFVLYHSWKSKLA